MVTVSDVAARDLAAPPAAQAIDLKKAYATGQAAVHALSAAPIRHCARPARYRSRCSPSPTRCVPRRRSRGSPPTTPLAWLVRRHGQGQRRRAPRDGAVCGGAGRRNALRWRRTCRAARQSQQRCRTIRPGMDGRSSSAAMGIDHCCQPGAYESCRPLASGGGGDSGRTTWARHLPDRGRRSGARHAGRRAPWPGHPQRNARRRHRGFPISGMSPPVADHDQRQFGRSPALPA
jgi:hypothetical protein